MADDANIQEAAGRVTYKEGEKHTTHRAFAQLLVTGDGV